MEHHNKINKNKDPSLTPITVQAKGVYLQDNRPSSILQRKANNTGLPDNLKSGIENLSGHAMDDVKVHYNSNKPAQLNAHAYAQGTNIHIASGQEKHLPHEAWHVAQQKQGRVKPTIQMKGKVNINDDIGLEKEADVMGQKAANTLTQLKIVDNSSTKTENSITQLVLIGHTYKTTANTNYRTKIADSNYLGVKPIATKPLPNDVITATGTKTSGYDEYKFSGQNFQNDCLSFAQRLGLSIAGRQANEILRVKLNDGTTTNVGFAIDKAPVYPPLVGVPNTKDIADKAEFSQGENANPSIGETYAIAPQSRVVIQGCYFHIATVVAKDGNETITCEADAGTQRAEPVFDMYETAAGNSFTFHARYKDQYGGQYAITGILTPPSGVAALADPTFP